MHSFYGCVIKYYAIELAIILFQMQQQFMHATNSFECQEKFSNLNLVLKQVYIA